jgi:hypothetical protein
MGDILGVFNISMVITILQAIIVFILLVVEEWKGTVAVSITFGFMLGMS